MSEELYTCGWPAARLMAHPDTAGFPTVVAGGAFTDDFIDFYVYE